jgi:hypothetical protein
VALLGRGCLVSFEDLVDDAQELAEPGFWARDALAIAGGFSVGKDLFEDPGLIL